MRAYKGFNKDIESVRGGKKMRFELGTTYEEENSKTASCGFHCAENPLVCLDYYPLDSDNRYFLIEVEGDIDEDDSDRIAGTKMTILRELTMVEFALCVMKYIIEHPRRTGWQKVANMIRVQSDEVLDVGEGHIGIARGPMPKVSGVNGAILGLILEPEPGVITAAKIFIVEKEYHSNTTYTLNDLREVFQIETNALTEVCNEKKAD